MRSARWCLLLGALLLGCSSPTTSHPSPPSSEPPWFEDITDRVSLDFSHECGATGTFLMPQIMGSGAALFDYDGDGRLDIYLLQHGGRDSKAHNRLYRQEPGGHFRDVSKGSGLDVTGFGAGVAIGDVDRDGWPDVLITEFGDLRLFRNQGQGTFVEISSEAGLRSVLWGTSASFVDLDRDGWLDLAVVNYVVWDTTKPCHDSLGRRDYCHPRQFPGSVTKLYRNLGGSAGRTVRFEDITEQAGLGKSTGPGLGIVCADFTGDAWPDLFIANDGTANRLWVNRRNGTFVDEAVERGVAYDGMGMAPANMGVGLGDVDGDGLFDLFVTHLTSETHTLWMQKPRGLFRDRTQRAGLAPPGSRGTGFGTALVDFDADGSLDVAVVNGRVARQKPVSEEILGPFWSQYAETNQLFANDGTGCFRDLSAANPDLCGQPRVSRGLAYGDVDGDGAVDLLVTTLGGRARLYRNIAPRSGRSLHVRVVDPSLQGDAYGAEVTVQIGERRWKRWVTPSSSYLCSNDVRVHFGLGHVERVDLLEVVWPDGQRELYPGVAVGEKTELLLKKGAGQPVKG